MAIFSMDAMSARPFQEKMVQAKSDPEPDLD